MLAYCAGRDTVCTLVLAAAAIFIIGYATTWPFTPAAMAVMYAAMAALCALQTFTYMQAPLRFVAMGLEFAAYAGILIFLFRSGIFRY
jgi:drug/metabolite transporter superfamily protein YnfA